MNDIEQLMKEVDLRVKKLADIFRFVLKYKIIFRGQGVEFAGLDEYTVNDDSRMIDWKASARSNELYIKILEEERDLNIIVLFDVSNSMFFGTTDMLKIEYAMVLAGTIAFASVEVGDRVGLCMFSDGVKKFLEPQGGNIQYYKILKEMVDKKNHGGEFDIKKALDFIGDTVGKKSIIIIVSDFIGKDNWEETLRTTRYKFEKMLGIMVRDPRDDYMPKGVGNIKLKDPYSGNYMDINIEKYREKFEEESRINYEKIKHRFDISNAGFVRIFTSDSFVKPIVKYFSST